MKQTLLLFIFTLVQSMLFGQDLITISPASYEATLTVDLKETPLVQDPTVTITNNADTSIRLKWDRFEIDKPMVWESQVCDPINCYFPNVVSNVDTTLGVNAPLEIGPGESIKVSLYIVPNETEGLGKFALDFSLVEKPDSIIGTAEFEVEIASVVVNTFEVLKRKEFRLYPNPATDYFQLSNAEDIDRVVLHNLVGRKVKVFNAYPGALYNVNQLPNGIYLVSLINNDYGVVRTLRLGKRNLSP